MSKKKPAQASARALRRERDRAVVKLAEARIKLSRMEAGGATDRPIEVTSASVIEPHALSLGCAACGETSSTRVEEHAAITTPDGKPLRVARMRCSRCGVRHEIWFRIGSPLPS